MSSPSRTYLASVTVDLSFCLFSVARSKLELRNLRTIVLEVCSFSVPSCTKYLQNLTLSEFQLVELLGLISKHWSVFRAFSLSVSSVCLGLGEIEYVVAYVACFTTLDAYEGEETHKSCLAKT